MRQEFLGVYLHWLFTCCCSKTCFLCGPPINIKMFIIVRCLGRALHNYIISFNACVNAIKILIPEKRSSYQSHSGNQYQKLYAVYNKCICRLWFRAERLLQCWKIIFQYLTNKPEIWSWFEHDTPSLGSVQ